MIYAIEVCYFATTLLFIFGLKAMSHPTTARQGVQWAGIGMALATVVTFGLPLGGGGGHMTDALHNLSGGTGEFVSNVLLVLVAIAVGGGVAYWSGRRVAMTDMPQMVAIYNGMGGGAAGAIAAVELFGDVELSPLVVALAVTGALIGTVSFSGSVVAWAKLDGRLKKTLRFPYQQPINLAVFVLCVVLGVIVVMAATPPSGVLVLFFLLALAFGAMVALPIGGADMPVIISLFNAFTGLAVAFEGFVLDNSAMIIAGTVVGAAGTLLTQLMAKAMNRPITNVLFSSWGALGGGGEGTVTEGTMKAMETRDAAMQMAFAGKVLIVPGYGLAVAQAQHRLWELVELLQNRGVVVKFAIHPVAGRMPGHMNVLLAEAGVPYDMIFDLEEINSEFATADVALVIGANDVVNPAAKRDRQSPLYGMPVLNADQAQSVLVVKRGRGTGFSGVENALFFLDNTHMVFGDGQKVVADMVQSVKGL